METPSVQMQSEATFACIAFGLLVIILGGCTFRCSRSVAAASQREKDHAGSLRGRFDTLLLQSQEDAPQFTFPPCLARRSAQSFNQAQPACPTPRSSSTNTTSSSSPSSQSSLAPTASFYTSTDESNDWRTSPARTSVEILAAAVCAAQRGSDQGHRTPRHSLTGGSPRQTPLYRSASCSVSAFASSAAQSGPPAVRSQVLKGAARGSAEF